MLRRGVGATIKNVQKEPPSARSTYSPLPPPGSHRMTKRILIVDDDNEVRALLKIALTSQRGFSVYEADNGLRGIELMEELLPDLVLVDMHMPGLNGYQFVMRAQKDEKLSAIPLFVVTSLTHESKKNDEEWRQSLGVTAFRSKPFQPMEILTVIDGILGLNGAKA
jgi:two-component system chemotaxis response regulator CheY